MIEPFYVQFYTLLASGLLCLLNTWFYGWPTRKLLQQIRRDRQRPAPQTEGPGVSVVMAVRNEAENLSKSLDRFLNQSYRSFELVVCNDNSTDHTASVLESYALHDPTLRPVTESNKRHPGKKKALATAIANSRNSWLLATDGDCLPASDNWIARMQEVRCADTQLVLGYGPYEKRPGWLNRWIRYEALYTAVQYLTAATNGRPYMGVGRNLAYSKQLFDSLGGFSAHEHLTGGDDDLLVNAAAHAGNTAVCTHPESWVYSLPKTSWTAYRRQKQRHLSVSHHYKLADKVWLALLAGSHVGHYLSLIVLLAFGLWDWVLIFYLLRMTVVTWRMRQLAAGLGERDLSVFVPLFDLAVAGYYLRFVNTILNTTHTSQSWQ